MRDEPGLSVRFGKEKGKQMDGATQDLSARRSVACRTMPTKVTTGWWACDLATEALTWSDGVYDLFDLPRGSVLRRANVAARYTPASRI
eukprot:gene45964-58891_t